MSEDTPSPVRSWQEIRAHAETRPTMYIGSQEIGHRSALSDVLRLVWQAKVFRHPQAVTIDLSPTQYVVRADCGPLIRPVQQIFKLGLGDTLGKNWRKEMKAYCQKQSSNVGKRDWRYCFNGPTGPRLDAPAYPLILARCGSWGLRTNEGLWCESYQGGIPIGKPFLLGDPSPIGLLSVAALDPQWFTGLPFTEEEVRFLAGLSHSRFVGHRMHGPHPNYTRGEVVTRWHPQDNLITERMLTVDGLRELL